jgi:phosphoribosyl 1,2-cyclic phosphate phosphodiesterase
MRLTILGSGGCAVIPKPLCTCRVCCEARDKGVPYARTGPALFVHDGNVLIDTPAEIAWQLNRARIERVDCLLYTHMDPDHSEGVGVVYHIANDFRSWQGYPEKRIRLIVPAKLETDLMSLRTARGSLVAFYEQQGYITCETFRGRIQVEETGITAVQAEEGRHPSFIYVLERDGVKAVYAPCDIKPFPEETEAVRDADLLIIQPGIFQDGLQHGFTYPADHRARRVLYTFEETMALASRIGAKETVFVHIEEYWNRSYDDYCELERRYDHIAFAYDGMEIDVSRQGGQG